VSLLGKAAGEIVRVFITTIHSIVLENLSHRFLKPNILDIKLGTRLYDDGASEEKKARMIQTAKDTTSFETGVRLTGFQVGNVQWLAFDVTELIRFRVIQGLRYVDGPGGKHPQVIWKVD